MKSLITCALLALAACKGGEAALTAETAGTVEGKHAEDGEHEEGGEHEEESGAIHLTPQQMKSADIKLARVEVRKETAVLEANGQIGAADDGQARVGVRVPGRVSALKASVGDLVKKGQTLALIESPELGGAKAEYVSAAASARLAKENAAREKQLYEKKISAEVEWRRAEAEAVRTAADLQAAENRLHALGVSDGQLPDTVKHFSSTVGASSPIDGVIVERDVTLGEMVTPEKTLFLVMNLSRVWLLVDVFEKDLGQVSIGQNVTVSVAAYAAEQFQGTVSHIGAIVEQRSRAVKVRIELANADGRLKPGMFARVSLSDTKGDEHEHLFVPVGAVQRTAEGTVVFVPGDEAGEFRAKTVKTGHEAGTSVAIESGLVAGDQVVVNGSFILKSELSKGSLGGGHSH